MSSELEKIAVLETKVDIMEKLIAEIRSEIRDVRKQLWMILGGLAALQAAAAFWIKFGGGIH